MKKRVVLGLSGGVDSSAAALILKEEGYDVIGVTFKNWDFETSGGNSTASGSCCSFGSIENARAVASQLDIPHYVFDITEDFSNEVIDDFVSEYMHGRTPNPCIRCNAGIRWRTLLEKAAKFDANFVATGHHARLRRNADTGEVELLKAKDEGKDQSYVLWGLTQRELSMTLYPVGELTKAEVRKRALGAGLKTAETPDSFEICFIPDNDYRRFIRENANGYGKEIESGEILTVDGEIVGFHEGYPFYTIGQRHGLGIALGEPAYVTAIDARLNRIMVGSKDDLLSDGCTLTGVNFIGSEPEGESFTADIKIRYRHSGKPGVVHRSDKGEWEVKFDRPVEALTPGQSAVFYDSERVIGGGVIERVI